MPSSNGIEGVGFQISKVMGLSKSGPSRGSWLGGGWLSEAGAPGDELADAPGDELADALAPGDDDAGGSLFVQDANRQSNITAASARA